MHYSENININIPHGTFEAAQGKKEMIDNLKYGYFDDANREYVISRPDTPSPWINYLGLEEYCALISNTAGGYSFFRDAKERRILKYRYNNLPVDRPGRYIYIKDHEAGKYWSASWQPVCVDLSNFDYECRHGLGYTKIKSRYLSLSTETLYFVPLGENAELWHVKFRNDSNTPRNLGIFSYVEFCLWEAYRENSDWDHAVTKFMNNTIYHVTQYPQRDVQNCYAYMWCSEPVNSYEGARRAFLGNYRSETNPVALEKGCCSNALAAGWSACGALHFNLHLKENEEKEVLFILGYIPEIGDEIQVCNRYREYANIDKALSAMKGYWKLSLGNYKVESDDKDVDRMVNIWNQLQCHTTFKWSRSASTYEDGTSRGMGFRDSTQDTQGFVHQKPEYVKGRLIDLISNQYRSGKVFHQYSPLDKRGYDEGYSDDHLWLPWAVRDYVKESGDLEFITNKLPYVDNHCSKDSVLNHLVQAIRYSWKNRGLNGLVKIQTADWNDCLKMNLNSDRNSAVSVMVSEQFVLAADITAELAGMAGENAVAEELQQMSSEMKLKINKHAWDGNYYVRAFDNEGRPVGSNENKEGKIWLTPQVWAVMSGVANNERSVKCMNSVKKYLASEYGVALLWPAYQEYDVRVGSLSSYPAGVKENGSIFCHAGAWAIIAEAILGRGDIAFEYYKAALPFRSEPIEDIHFSEPYVYSQTIKSKEHCNFGEATNSWLTGAAVWNFIAISQYILGIKGGYTGLEINPCVPRGWRQFTVIRKYRGATYRIRVENPQGLNRGIHKIFLNGRQLSSRHIPLCENGKEHNVKIVMGNASLSEYL